MLQYSDNSIYCNSGKKHGLIFMIYPIILCGGHGARLWPISRENLPKQFIGFASETSLLQNSIKRIEKLPGINNLYIITNQEHKLLAEEQLAEISVKEAKIILEPCVRSTAPAVTLAALDVYEQNPDAIMMVFSSDHDIKHAEKFKKLMLEACDFALKNNKFVLISSKALYSETDYGYIKHGKVVDVNADNNELYLIENFIEKPNKSVADGLIKDGYQWNTGIFVLPAKLYVEQMNRQALSTISACKKSLQKARKTTAEGSNYRIIAINGEEFEKCEASFVDEILTTEPENATVISSSIGWSDVGSWKSIYSVQNKDMDGNVIKAEPCISVNSHNIQVYSNNKNKLIAAVNLEDVTIVDSEDAVLVLNTKYSQEVREVVNTLRLRHMGKFLFDNLVRRSWGYSDTLLKRGGFVLKKLTIYPGKTYSCKGSSKSKHFVMVRGQINFSASELNKCFKKNASFSYDIDGAYKIHNPHESNIVELIKVEF
ncbi:MAG: mannose-phosphate guanyltransferase [Candidatus Midichloriaceae bacterium]|jgi:mannose-1-phosphate guanylyltransferase/mannose-6-phosphate isomerase|nr:mannose-phosphate guanyltransferase [Candidatus Midichloriaceae bacterium]